MGRGRAEQIVVSCNTRKECSDFLERLKGRSKSERAPVPASAQIAGEPPQVKPQPTNTAQTGQTPRMERANAPAQPPIQPSAPGRAPGADSFHDVLDGIGWKKGNGTEALDDLLKQTKVEPKPPRPPAEKPTFAAFAQSAGFNANSGWGYAVGSDLNSTIGRANTACSTRSGTFCGDEGYCMLKPGLWGAWASDQKYFGARGLACNFKSQDEAIDRALLWCGGGCRALWIGAGQ